MNAEDCPIHAPLIDQPGGVLYPWVCSCPEPVEPAPKAEVRATRYEVSLLPEDDINYPFYAIAVEARGNGRWAVVRHKRCLGPDGAWSWESIPSEREDDWLATHRFDRDTAIRLAKQAAPTVTVNGITAAQAAARRVARAGFLD